MCGCPLTNAGALGANGKPLSQGGSGPGGALTEEEKRTMDAVNALDGIDSVADLLPFVKDLYEQVGADSEVFFLNCSLHIVMLASSFFIRHCSDTCAKVAQTHYAQLSCSCLCVL